MPKKWLVPLQDQPVLIRKAIGGDQAAQTRFLDCYRYLLNEYVRACIDLEDRADLYVDLSIEVIRKIMPRLLNLRGGHRAYPAYMRKAVLGARNRLLERLLRPKDRSTSSGSIEEWAGCKDEVADSIAKIVLERLSQSPETLRQSPSLSCAAQITHFARKLKLQSNVLRLAVIRALVATDSRRALCSFLGRGSTLFWFSQEELNRIRAVATDSQKTVLDLLLQGFSHSEIASKTGIQRSNVTRAVKALTDRCPNRQQTVTQYFRSLSREHVEVARRIAAPRQLEILNMCLNGKNVVKIAKKLKQANTSIQLQLKGLRGRLHRVLSGARTTVVEYFRTLAPTEQELALRIASPKQRLILRLCLEGKPWRQIKAQAGFSGSKTTYHYLARLRRRLQKGLSSSH